MKNLNCDLKIAGFGDLSIRDTSGEKDSRTMSGGGAILFSRREKFPKDICVK